jgi:hypothetical protein
MNTVNDTYVPHKTKTLNNVREKQQKKWSENVKLLV